MLGSLKDTWEEDSSIAFTLRNLEGFPIDDWELQKARYEEEERWFTGAALDLEVQKKDNPTQETDLYPLRINPLVNLVIKHAHILFGEYLYDGRPLVRPKLIPKENDETNKTLVEQAEEALFTIWWESHGNAIMMENALLSQIYGGCIFKLTYVPEETDRLIPLLVERINPKGFYGIPDASDMYRLSEAWIVKQITNAQAKKYGYTGEDKVVWYSEHWTKQNYKVRINDRLVTKVYGNEQYPLGGENPYGIVPLVYIPHIRIAAFLGMDTISHLKGLIKEMNLRYGDYGDAVNDDSHSLIAMRNVTGKTTTVSVSGRDVVDLGTAQGISGNEKEPDLFEVTSTRASASMRDLVGEIYKQYRRDAADPPVADGEDEGSQRSALTLATRFWPLLGHSDVERIFWSAGMNVINTYMLKMMQIKKLGEITEKHLGMRMKQKWAPQLPRDREADVQEWVQRSAADLGSRETLLELTGDVEDLDEEQDRMIEWIKRVETEKAKIAKEYAPAPTTPFGNKSSSSSSSSGDQSGSKK